MNRDREEHQRKMESSFRDRRKPYFCKNVLESDYAKRFLEKMQLQPSWSVLNVGCGSGPLATLLAGSAASLTVLDFSSELPLQQHCSGIGITNITTIHGRWEDDWEMLGIGTYDVVIASCSIEVGDLRDAMIKLDRAARQRVYISAMVGEGPNDHRFVEAERWPLKSGPDYIFIYNLLHQMGIYANVSFITGNEWKSYVSIDQAIDGMRWLLDELSPEEKNRLENYLVAELVPHGGGWRLPVPKAVRWAVISWEKKE